MKVFLTGASGYIGGAVAEYLRKAGHHVLGLARSGDAVRKLEAMGVEPRSGDLADSTGIAAAARESDAVVHTAMGHGPDAPKLDELAVRAILEALKGTHKPFAYTSGVWVLGDTRGKVASELAVLRPPAIVAWRPAVEKLVIASADQKVNGTVLRPGIVYGRGGGAIGYFVRQAKKTRTVRVAGNGENHWCYVHVDALAELYVRVVEQAPRGELFFATDGPAYTVRIVAETVATMHDAHVEFLSLEESTREMGPMAEALVMDQRIMTTKAGRLLGWGPKWPGVLDEIRSGSYAS